RDGLLTRRRARELRGRRGCTPLATMTRWGSRRTDEAGDDRHAQESGNVGDLELPHPRRRPDLQRRVPPRAVLVDLDPRALDRQRGDAGRDLPRRERLPRLPPGHPAQRGPRTVVLSGCRRARRRAASSTPTPISCPTGWRSRSAATSTSTSRRSCRTPGRRRAYAKSWLPPASPRAGACPTRTAPEWRARSTGRWRRLSPPTTRW